MFTRLPNSSPIAPDMTAQEMTTVSEMGPTIVVSLPKLRVLRQKPTS
jgi:hypothetical protein